MSGVPQTFHRPSSTSPIRCRCQTVVERKHHQPPRHVRKFIAQVAVKYIPHNSPFPFGDEQSSPLLENGFSHDPPSTTTSLHNHHQSAATALARHAASHSFSDLTPSLVTFLRTPNYLMLHTFPSSENPSYNTINKQIYIKLGTFNNNQQFLLVYDFCLQKYFNDRSTILFFHPQNCRRAVRYSPNKLKKFGKSMYYPLQFDT